MYVINNGEHYIAIKEIIIDETTNVNNLTLEELDVVSAIKEPIVGKTKIRYLGVVDNISLAKKYFRKPEKHLKLTEQMYGDGWKIIKKR